MLDQFDVWRSALTLTERILDLTKPIDSSLEIYTENNYRDPHFSCVEWSTVEKQDYRVSAITLGTQTGTHIDAPAHFDPAGKCLEALPLENLVGRYYLLDLPKDTNEADIKALCASYSEEGLLFLRSDESGASFITRQALDILLELPPIVWVLDGDVKVEYGSPLEFHRFLALRGKYLIENLHTEAARRVRPGGELLALPLALVGTSGAPCRVVVKEARTP
jgi:arylformamidase